MSAVAGQGASAASGAEQVAEVAHAVADAAASGFEFTSRAQRSGWLRALAAALEADRGQLLAIARIETHLSEARLDGEISRTAAQLRFFADVALEGSYLEATIDSPDGALLPPRPALRRMLRPLGVVAVFAASNFPFAFSVLGNDTASALAAGCPVVVKAHPGHPELSRRVAALAVRTLADTGAPAGCLALVEGVDAGVALVQHPLVSAVGFTGSTRGGRALFDLACVRSAPIPFYGELGSLNPVVVTPAGAAADVTSIAAGLAGSFTRDGGQYCTKPGIVFIPDGAGFEAALATALAGVVETAPAQQLLTDGMTAAFAAGSATLAERADSEVIFGAEAGAAVGAGPGAAAAAAPVDGVGAAAVPVTSAPVVIATSAAAFTAAHDIFLEECFGPLTVLVRYADAASLQAALAVLDGSLTATIHCAPGEDVAELAASLTRIAGRLLFNGWPTGVAIAWGQHHGGPWPSTTASVHSSVGASAIRRWLAPIAYQDAPASVLPPELRDGNPLGIPRREDGRLVGA
ncbi:MAG: aldehyde dehydrogenase family protein [Microbacteriaceae bacterium]|nr:MAG: aldehyde dehydrogenase family protein [Microbacteriaceae bacterium]